MKNNQKRLTVLDFSLDLEWLTSRQLSRLLKFDNQKDSISFGETGQALSFNQKINLLLDSRDIEKSSKPFFQTFMEIRNKFIHNNDINTYLEACESSKKVTFLKKHFKEESIDSDIELFLEKAVNKLYRKCAITLIEINGLITENEKNESELDFKRARFDTLFSGVKESLEICTSKLEQTKKYSFDEVNSLFQEFTERLNIKMMTEGLNYMKKTKSL